MHQGAPDRLAASHGGGPRKPRESHLVREVQFDVYSSSLVLCSVPGPREFILGHFQWPSEVCHRF